MLIHFGKLHSFTDIHTDCRRPIHTVAARPIKRLQISLLSLLGATSGRSVVTIAGGFSVFALIVLTKR